MAATAVLGFSLFAGSGAGNDTKTILLQLDPIPVFKTPKPKAAVNPSSAGISQDTINQYLARIAAQIESAKRYPEPAKKKNLEGEARVEFVVLSSGEIAGLNLTASTSHAILDNQAVETIKSAAPFPPIPKEWKKSEIKIVLPIVFFLRES